MRNRALLGDGCAFWGFENRVGLGLVREKG